MVNKDQRTGVYSLIFLAALFLLFTMTTDIPWLKTLSGIALVIVCCAAAWQYRLSRNDD